MRCFVTAIWARTQLVVQLASMIGCQAVRDYWVMLGTALAVGVTPIEFKEIVCQAGRRARDQVAAGLPFAHHA
jgi:hypothetical protein